MVRWTLALSVAWIGCIFSASACYALNIAAASDLRFALEEIVKNYSKTHEKPQVTYGSSGSLATQILQNAPYDLFLTADQKHGDLLGQKVRGKIFQYGRGRLVLWTQFKDSSGRSLRVLLDPAIRKIAIANPRHAPYGFAAVEALKAAGIYEQIQDKLVIGENIAQAAQFVQSGAAQAGMIARSLIPPGQSGHYFPVPESLYPPLIQVGMVIQGPNETLAKQFRDFMLSDAGLEILKKYGLASH